MEDFENKTFTGLALETIYLKMTIDADNRSVTLASTLQGNIIAELNTIKNQISSENAIVRSEMVTMKNDLNVAASIMNNDLKSQIGTENSVMRSEMVSMKNDLKSQIGTENSVMRSEMISMKNELTAKDALTMAEVTTLNNKINPLLGVYTGTVLLAGALVAFIGMAFSKFDWVAFFNK